MRAERAATTAAQAQAAAAAREGRLQGRLVEASIMSEELDRLRLYALTLLRAYESVGHQVRTWFHVTAASEGHPSAHNGGREGRGGCSHPEVCEHLVGAPRISSLYALPAFRFPVTKSLTLRSQEGPDRVWLSISHNACTARVDAPASCSADASRRGRRRRV